MFFILHNIYQIGYHLNYSYSMYICTFRYGYSISEYPWNTYIVVILNFNYLYPNSKYISYNLIEESSNAPLFWCSNMLHVLYLHFQSPNSRSEPLNIIFIIKYAWRPNFIFFRFFFTIFLDRYNVTLSDGPESP